MLVPSAHTFRRLLKTHCFKQAFSPFLLTVHTSASDSATVKDLINFLTNPQRNLSMESSQYVESKWKSFEFRNIKKNVESKILTHLSLSPYRV